MKAMRKNYLLLCIIIIAVVGLFIYAALRPKPVSKPGSEADFLKQAEEKASGVAKSEGEGTLPPPGETTLVPKIVLDPAGELDVGIIPNDKIYQTQFKIYNRGKSNLKILRISTECACTVGRIDPAEEIVRPGAFSTVHVTIDPTRIIGFLSKKRLTINSDDPVNQVIDMMVIANVDPEFSMEPEMLDFGEFKKGSPIEKTILIRYLKDPPQGELTIKRLPEIVDDVLVTKTQRPQNEWKAPNRPEYILTVQLTDTINPGDFRVRFYLENACTRIPSFPVNSMGKALTFYSVKPTSRKVLLRSEATTAMKASPHLTLAGQKPFEITDVLCSDPGIAFAVAPGKEPNSKIITFSLTPDADKKTRIVPIRYTVKAADETASERGTVRIISGLPGQRNPGDTKETTEAAIETETSNGEPEGTNPELSQETVPTDSAVKPK